MIDRTGGVKAPRHSPAEFGDEIARDLDQQRILVKKLGMANN